MSRPQISALASSPETWTVVLTQAQAEWQVYCALLKQGFEVLLPWTLHSARHGRWARGVVRPIYPGYLFLRLDASLEAVKRTPGVRDLLKLDGGRVVMLGAAEIDRLRGEWLALHNEAMPRRVDVIRLKVGDIVRVPAGPLLGLPVYISAIDKSGFVTANLGQLVVTFHRSACDSSVRGSAKPAKS